MPLTLRTIPCRSDNYAFLVGNEETGEAALIDIPEAGPINAVLSETGWKLTHVLITHHHGDHVEGLSGLAMTTDTIVVGAAADAHRLPPLDLQVGEGDTLQICGEPAEVIDVSGHTKGHIAYHFPKSGYAFTADSLMAMGCGRLFEGTPEMMWRSMLKLRDLPPETLICSGHEYTAANAKFAATLEADNPTLTSRIKAIEAARRDNLPTVPSSLADEIATNPFLRADDPAFQASVGMKGADPIEVFAEIRSRKDHF